MNLETELGQIIFYLGPEESSYLLTCSVVYSQYILYHFITITASFPGPAQLSVAFSTVK